MENERDREIGGVDECKTVRGKYKPKEKIC